MLPVVEDQDRGRALAGVALVAVDLLHDPPAAQPLVGQDAPAGTLGGRGGLRQLGLEADDLRQGDHHTPCAGRIRQTPDAETFPPSPHAVPASRQRPESTVQPLGPSACGGSREQQVIASRQVSAVTTATYDSAAEPASSGSSPLRES